MNSLAATPVALAEAVLHAHSRSFTLASRLLAPADRADVAVLYAWCRRADDLIDLPGSGSPAQRLLGLRRELAAVGDGEALSDPLLTEFRRVLDARGIPLQYPGALLDGLEMDVRGPRFVSFEDLLAYCWHVAGVVGVMLCHVFGVSDPSARRQAAHLGIAMQLTNVCRDVLEDWERGRLYLPDQLLEQMGAPELRRAIGGPLPLGARSSLGAAVAHLLDQADRFYRSADQGMRFLPFRSGMAARIARHVYSDIGSGIRRQGCDVFAGRSVVPTARKLLFVTFSLLESLTTWPKTFGARPAELPGVVEFGTHDLA